MPRLNFQLIKKYILDYVEIIKINILKKIRIEISYLIQRIRNWAFIKIIKWHHGQTSREKLWKQYIRYLFLDILNVSEVSVRMWEYV